ncbi:MAG: hypothetical protein KKF46_04355 [Nanoarchaeota archaeon]|nr:hypothetical protein [Nanoarchaeota archaeon]MBU1321568.1 hypothetical protein [Nanoarchaeota archaeon]MBU1596848.1 hypothetical protein [Nanoarchaeota archaeon]MBU2442118.1 hypothetical protein [Nanoarchaeota archaeon]
MWELKKELEMRKENLIYTLQSKKDFLELEKQHQIYGAIKELDHILKLFENYREEEMLTKHRAMVLNTSETHEEPVMKKVEEKTKKFKIPIRFKFAKDDA